MRQPAEGGPKNGPCYHLPLFDPGLCFGSYTSFMSNDYPA